MNAFIEGSARGDVLERLHSAFIAAASANETRIIDLVGSPGVGKTRLVQELYRLIAENQAVWPKSLIPPDDSASGSTWGSLAATRKRISVVELLRMGEPVGAGQAPWTWSAVACRVDDSGSASSDVTSLEREIHSLVPHLGMSSSAADVLRRLLAPVASSAGQDVVGMIVPVPGLGTALSLASEMVDEVGARRSAAAESTVDLDREARQALISAVEVLSTNRPEMPLIFVVEDAQYGDQLLFDVVMDLARRESRTLSGRRSGIVVVLTSWNEHRAALDAFEESVFSVPGTHLERIELEPFDPAELVPLVRERAPATSTESATTLTSNVHGNPHLLGLQMDLLDDEWGPYADDMVRGSGSERAYEVTAEQAARLPNTAREAIVELWNGLDPKTKFVLSVAAQQGNRFDPVLVADVAAGIGPAVLDRSASAEALAEAEDRDRWIRQLAERVKWFYEPDRHWVAESHLDEARTLAVAEETERWMRSWRASDDFQSWFSTYSERTDLLLRLHVRSGVTLLKAGRGDTADLDLALDSGLKLLSNRYLNSDYKGIGQLLADTKFVAESLGDWASLARACQLQFEQGSDLADARAGSEALASIAENGDAPASVRVGASVVISNGTPEMQERGYAVVDRIASGDSPLEDRIAAAWALSSWGTGGKHRAGEVALQIHDVSADDRELASALDLPSGLGPSNRMVLAGLAALSPASSSHLRGRSLVLEMLGRADRDDLVFGLWVLGNTGVEQHDVAALLSAAVEALQMSDLTPRERSLIDFAIAQVVVRAQYAEGRFAEEVERALASLTSSGLASLRDCAATIRSAESIGDRSQAHSTGLRSAVALSVTDAETRADALKVLDSAEFAANLTFFGRRDLARAKALLDPTPSGIASAFALVIDDEATSLTRRVNEMVGFCGGLSGDAIWRPLQSGEGQRELFRIAVMLILRHVDELGYSVEFDPEGHWLFLLAVEWERAPETDLGEQARQCLLAIGRSSLTPGCWSSSPATWTRTMHVVSGFERVKETEDDESLILSITEEMYAGREVGGYEARHQISWLLRVMGEAGNPGAARAVQLASEELSASETGADWSAVALCRLLIDKGAEQHYGLVRDTLSNYLDSFTDPIERDRRRRNLRPLLEQAGFAIDDDLSPDPDASP